MNNSNNYRAPLVILAILEIKDQRVLREKMAHQDSRVQLEAEESL